jgi:hypothetical protein
MAKPGKGPPRTGRTSTPVTTFVRPRPGATHPSEPTDEEGSNAPHPGVPAGSLTGVTA